MKKLLLLLSCICVFSFSGLGQISEKISNELMRSYYQPNLKRQILTFNSSGLAEIKRDQDWKNNQGGDFFSNLNYRLLKYDRKKQLDMYGYLGYSHRDRQRGILVAYKPAFQEDPLDFSDQVVSKELNSVISFTNRMYYHPSHHFILSPMISLRHRNNTTIFAPTIVEGFLRIGWGIGRIENVSDAVSTLRILDQLMDKGIMATDIEENSLWSTSDLFAELNNLRKLDFRMKRVHELTQMGAFLKSNFLIHEDDILFMSNLQDMYRYERFLYSRSRGQRMELFFDMDIDTRDNKIFIANVDHQLQKPVNKKIQLSFNNRLSYHYLLETDPTFSNVEGGFFRIFSSFDFGYFPQARTSVTLGADFTYNRTINDRFYNYLSSNASINHYFSPATLMRLNINYIFRGRIVYPNNQLQISFSFEQNFF